MSFETFLEIYWTAVQNPLIGMGVVLFLDLVFGVIVALKTGLFEWVKLADFASTNLPKTLIWLAVELLLALPVDVFERTLIDEAAARGVYAFIMVSFIGSLLGHWMELGGWPGDGRKVLGLKATNGQ